MFLKDIFTASAVAIYHANVPSNSIPYLGAALFPAKKKMGLDLKWIKTRAGLPVSLAPSNFDAVSTLRSRVGIDVAKTQMAFFRESMLIKEEDEQEIMRVQEASDPYAQQVLQSIYNDSETLVAGADVVPERMRMQLLAPESGSPKIYIKANNVTYEYNYDPNGTYVANNYKVLSGTSLWTDTTNSDPLQDVSDAQSACETYSGMKPSILIVSKTTMNLIKKNAKIKNYVLAQNVGANVMMNDARVQALFSTELGVFIIVYEKKYKDEAGVAHNFYPDGYATLIPNGALGSTWYGTTPEERTLMQTKNNAQVSIVNTGVAVAVTTTSDAPIQTKTTVSEIVLPSYENMDSTYVLKVA